MTSRTPQRRTPPNQVPAPRTLRAVGHRLVDAVRGGEQAKVMAKLALATESDAAAHKIAGDCLRNLLDHAAAHSPVYDEIDVGAPLTAFPVVDKNFLRDEGDRLLVRGLSRDALHRATTSGSTGTPLTVLQDHGRRVQRSAEAVYFSELAGHALGTRLYHLKVWSGRNQKSRIGHFAQNTVPVDIIKFNDTEISALLTMMHRRRGRRASIIAYSSALEALARHVQQNPTASLPRVKTIIAQSEAISSDAKTILQHRFGAPVISRYGMEEVGIIGQQRPYESDYTLNRAGVFVEILQFDSDQPADPGDSGRIVVTDLHNLAMPVIRYDTGDMGTFATTADGEADPSRLTSVEGRRLDQLFDTQDQRVSSWIFYKFFWKYSHVRQFQLRQTARGEYSLTLNCDGGCEDSALVDDLREHLGHDAVINLSHSDDIPVLASGKRRQIVSDYAPLS